MRNYFNLQNGFYFFKKKIFLILICLCCTTLFAGVSTFALISPVYQSSAEIIVRAKDSESTNLQSSLSANILMINTFKDMIEGNMVLNRVSHFLKQEKDIDLSKEDLKNSVNVSQSENSQMFQIQATSESNEKAAIIANTVAKIFQEEAYEILDVSKVTITSEAEVSEKPISPNNKLNLSIGAIVGIMLGVFFSFLIDFFDKTIKNVSFFNQNLGIPLVGSINEISFYEVENEGTDLLSQQNLKFSSSGTKKSSKDRSKRNNKTVSSIPTINEDGVIADQYRMLSSNILFASIEKKIKTIVVTSAGPSEGKSTTSINLAVTYARKGINVCLVDADLRKPSIMTALNLSKKVGLSDVLVDQNAQVNDYVEQTKISGFSVLGSGPQIMNPSEALIGRRMEEITESLKQNFDLIIFDTSPALIVPETQVISAKADGVLLVVREEKTNKQQLLETLKLLKLAKANIIGAVYNGIKNPTVSYDYYQKN